MYLCLKQNKMKIQKTNKEEFSHIADFKMGSLVEDENGRIYVVGDSLNDVEGICLNDGVNIDTPDLLVRLVEGELTISN